MYVCICNAVSEKQIQKAVEKGANCLQHLESQLGVATQCGSCACEAKDCLNRAMESQMNALDLSV